MKKDTPGRPSKFIPELHIKIAEAYAMAGLTNEQIARECGVSYMTFKNWLNQYPELLSSIKEAKELPDGKVEASLFQRAKGYSVKATKIFCSKDGLVTKVPYIEHYPPDTAAAIFWLKNRKPKKWRDKREITANVKNTRLTDAELDAEIAKREKEIADGNKGK